MGCSERPGAVKGAPKGAALRTLEGEDRSERIEEEGKQILDSGGRFLKRGASERAARVSTMVLSEARGL